MFGRLGKAGQRDASGFGLVSGNWKDRIRSV